MSQTPEDDPAFIPCIVIHGGASASAASLKDYRTALHTVLANGQALLQDGHTAVDIAAECCRQLEEIPFFNAGKGAVFNCEGQHELDASIMRGSDLASGSVAAAQTLRNPILVAKHLLVKGNTVLLAGRGADLYGQKHGCCDIVSNDWFDTEERKEQFRHTANLSIAIAVDQSAPQQTQREQAAAAAARGTAIVESSSVAPPQFAALNKRDQSIEPPSRGLPHVLPPSSNVKASAAASRVASVGAAAAAAVPSSSALPSPIPKQPPSNQQQHQPQLRHRTPPGELSVDELENSIKQREEERRQYRRLQQQQQEQEQQQQPPGFSTGTVGAVVLDTRGNIAAATSSGGLTNKPVGRVADTGLIGCGTYASDPFAGVSCAGSGEILIRATTAYSVVARMRFGHEPFFSACDQAIFEDLAGLGGVGGLIAVDPSGNVAMPFSSTAMPRGFVQVQGLPRVAVVREPLRTLEELEQ